MRCIVCENPTEEEIVYIMDEDAGEGICIYCLADGHDDEDIEVLNEYAYDSIMSRMG
jgi:hypothetical protein